MEQSDIDLLQTAPLYHVQAVLKARQSPQPLLQRLNTAAAETPEVVAELARYLFDENALQHVLTTLDASAHSILQELVACGGRANSRDLALYFLYADLLAPTKKPPSPTQEIADRGMARPYSEGNASLAAQFAVPTMPQYPTAHPHGVFEQSLRHLLLQGLLFWGRQTSFTGRDYTSGVHDGVVIVPQAVKEAARQLWGLPVKFPIDRSNDQQQGAGAVQSAMSSGEEESYDVGEHARRVQRTLYLYWSLVAATRDGLALLSSGLLARIPLRQVLEQVGMKMQSEQVRSESDAPRLLFMRLLLMKLGLLEERQNSIHVSSMAAALAFFSLPLLERVRLCYRLWLETPFWNELLYLPEVHVRPGASPLENAHEEVVRARKLVMERLMYERLQEWHQFITMIARTKLYIPNLLFPRNYGPRSERYSAASNPYAWDFRLRRGWLTHREGWHMVEGGFIRAIIAGPLHWLGLAELDHEDIPTAFRLPAALPHSVDETVPVQADAHWGRLIVQPNFELIALAPVSEALLVRLDRFAERMSLELIAQYRLTKASVTRAIQLGMHAETIQRILEQAAESTIPQNIAYSLLEWERQARRIELWQNATLLEVDDPHLLDLLFAEEAAQPFLRRRISPTLAEVAPRALPQLQALLWQRDYLPSVVTAPTQDTVRDNGRFVVRECQWLLHANGLLEPLYPVLDLYLVAEIAHFSDVDEQSGWRSITDVSLQKALTQGKSLDDIIAFLQQYCLHGIPSSFLIRLKLWGGGYGTQSDIAVERVPLLRLSAAVLADLQADADLRPLLGSEVDQQSRLVRVPPEHLERIITLLRERGFAVDP